jgi:hypothetical protein
MLPGALSADLSEQKRTASRQTASGIPTAQQRTWYWDPADCFQHQRSQRYPQRIIQNPTQLMLTSGYLNIKNYARL